jgi:hypothetical protein
VSLNQKLLLFQGTNGGKVTTWVGMLCCSNRLTCFRGLRRISRCPSLYARSARLAPSFFPWLVEDSSEVSSLQLLPATLLARLRFRSLLCKVFSSSIQMRALMLAAETSVCSPASACFNNFSTPLEELDFLFFSRAARKALFLLPSIWHFFGKGSPP